MITISAHHLKKSFTQGKNSYTVLEDASAQFTQGTGYAITGHSGSGKTTLMHLLACIDTPDVGEIFYNDQNMQLLKPTARAHYLHNTIGLVFQLPYLIAELTVIENVMTKGLIAGLPIDACTHEAQHLLELVGIPEKALAQPATLSGGQQQRVAIARALFNKPAFLLADEPTGNLDEKTSASIIELLIQCKNNWDMGLIISSHDPAITQKLDAHYHLENGLLKKIES